LVVKIEDDNARTCWYGLNSEWTRISREWRLREQLYVFKDKR
jgi:hypothetical protein